MHLRYNPPMCIADIPDGHVGRFLRFVAIGMTRVPPAEYRRWWPGEWEVAG